MKAAEDDLDVACSWFTLDKQLIGNCHTAGAPIKVYSPISLLFSIFPLTSPSQQCLPTPSPAPSTQQTRFLPTFSNQQTSFWSLMRCHKEAESKTLKLTALMTSVRVFKSSLLWGQCSHPDSDLIGFTGRLARAGSQPQACAVHGSGSYQVCFMRILKPSGQVEGTGRCRLLLPTPQMMAEESTSL